MRIPFIGYWFLLVYCKSFSTSKQFSIGNNTEATLNESSEVMLFKGFANDPFGPSVAAERTQFHSKYSLSSDVPFRKRRKASGSRGPQSSAVVIKHAGSKDNGPIKSGENNKEYRFAKKHKRRSKRGVIQLYNMVGCATGCDPLIYKGYGCYCGFLGSGRPVDGIDKCCKMHDLCYDSANCPMYLEYIVPYYWKCYRGKSLCAIDHLDLGGSGSCAQRLCECDKLLAECLSRFPCPNSRAKCVSSPWRLLQNTLMFF